MKARDEIMQVNLLEFIMKVVEGETKKHMDWEEIKAKYPLLATPKFLEENKFLFRKKGREHPGLELDIKALMSRSEFMFEAEGDLPFSLTVLNENLFSTTNPMLDKLFENVGLVFVDVPYNATSNSWDKVCLSIYNFISFFKLYSLPIFHRKSLALRNLT